jgi:tetraacyldisaccharide 4'-kinase
MIAIRKLLLPLSALHGGILRMRHFAFNTGILTSKSVEVPTIVVGNLAMGGTGKSPVTLYLAEWLSENHRIAILSRGYGRKSKGFRLLNDADTASSAGDEPLMFYKRDLHRVDVAVCENRLEGIQRLMSGKQAPDLIVLDDALQHRKLKGGFNVLLSTCARPFTDDYLFPAGNLRDIRSRASVVDAILWTKCKQKNINPKAKQYSNAPQFSCGLEYGELKYITPKKNPTDKVVLLTGIASTRELSEKVESEWNLIRHFNYPDHHNYSKEELREVDEFAAEHGATIITTEKDAARLYELLDAENCKSPIAFLPIQLMFHHGEPEFRKLVMQKINP